jgi:putative endonuclease
MGYLAGLAGEDCVIRTYEQAGYHVVQQRWRGLGGEIDLIVRGPGTLVFVEVKTCRSFDRAAQRIGPRQMARIYAAAEEFLDSQPLGALTPSRFDAALVDGHGAVRIIENAFGH